MLETTRTPRVGNKLSPAFLLFLALLSGCSGDGMPTQESTGPRPVDQISVAITPERDSLLLGTNRKFAAAVTNQFGEPRVALVTWKSTNSEVLSIASGGLVTAVGTGSAQIVATVAGSSDTSFVTVYGLTTALHVVPEALKLAIGEDAQVAAITGSSSSGYGTVVLWSSSNTGVATVDANGLITAVSEGTVEITATMGNSTARALVEVFAAPVAFVTVSPSMVVVEAGTFVQLDATPRDDAGTALKNRSVSWSSSDVSVATVTPTGLVTAVARGMTTIEAEVEGVRSSASINVQPPTVASVSASIDDHTLSIGQNAQATASAIDASGGPISGLQTAWQSSNPGVATVNSAGRVTAISDGTAKISAIIGGKVGTITVDVGSSIVAEMAILPESPSLGVGSTLKLIAILDDATGSLPLQNGVAWTSSNPSVLSVSADGTISGLSSGFAEVTATWQSFTAAVRITVTSGAVASLSVSPTTVTMDEGETEILKATARNSSGSVIQGGSVAWTSSNPSVAVVSAQGAVTAVSAGSATVTAKSQGKTASASIIVKKVQPSAVHDVQVVANSTALIVGQSTQAQATIRDKNGVVLTGRTITWSTSIPAIASVSPSGLVDAKAPGTVTLIANSEGVKGQTSIVVAAAPPTGVASVTVTLSKATINAGSTSEAIARVWDSKGKELFGRSLTFSSSDPAVATISTDGLVTGLASGTAIITAASGGKTGQSSLKVNGGASSVHHIQIAAPSTIVVGDSTYAQATAFDIANKSMSATFTWTSSKTSVLLVTQSGKLKAMSAGNATLTARANSNGVTATYGITVTSKPSVPPVVASIAVGLGNSSLTVGQTTQVTATLKDASGSIITGPSVNFSSSNTAVATVGSSGVVTAVSVGGATISATSGSITGSASLSVTQAAPPPPPSSGSSSGLAARPALPNAFVDVTWKSPTGATINVSSGGNLQQALNSAKPGDEIVLASGATFTGNFTLPAKSGSGWILVRSAGSIPGQGKRLTTSNSSGLAKIQTSNVLPAIQTDPGAKGWRFVGIEFTAASSVTAMTAILSLGDGGSAQNTLAKVPQNLVFDRVWVHGHANLNLRRCIALNSASTAIINSTIDQCHDKGFDSQAIWGWNGPGPFLIENNYLEGSSENVGFGGGTPQIPNLVPSDIIIRRNHIAKPASWKNAAWLIKNLIEFKNGRRILIEENLIEGNWQQGQAGYAIQLTPRSEGGACKSWCVIEDLTFRWNHVRRTGSGMNLSGRADPDLVKPSTRFLFENNLWDEINTGIYTAQGRIWLLQSNGLSDVTFSHNTAFGTDMTILFCDKLGSVEIEDNILSSAPGYGLWGCNGKPSGVPSISEHVQTWSYLRNITINVPATQQPTGNFYTSLSGVGFVNAGSRNWALSSNSPYKGQGAGGSDPGVDYTGLMSRLSGVVVP